MCDADRSDTNFNAADYGWSRMNQIEKWVIETTVCPVCNAPIGVACVLRNEYVHQQRLKAAEERERAPGQSE